jgi:outer membrane immunogenic protein
VKRLLVAGIAAAAFCAPALAAPPPPPVFNWTGFYVGGNIGSGLSRATWTDTFEHEKISTDEGSGLIGGGQVGFDYQVGNLWVIGVRGMLDRTNLTTQVGQDVSCSACGLIDYSKVTSFSTVTGRIGYLFRPDSLIYIKAGEAWVADKFSQTETAGFNRSHSVKRSGYDVGTGVEVMVASGWSLFLEYDYANFGKVHFADFSDQTDIKQNVQVVLFGANVRFGGR